MLLRKTGNGFVPIARTTVRVHVRGRGGVRTGIFTTRFSHQRSGRYVVRAIFRGDEHLHAQPRPRPRPSLSPAVSLPPATMTEDA